VKVHCAPTHQMTASLVALDCTRLVQVTGHGASGRGGISQHGNGSQVAEEAGIAAASTEGQNVGLVSQY